MNSRRVRFLALAAIVVGVFLLVIGSREPIQSQGHPQSVLGTAFTYQGYLEDSGGSIEGACDFQFSLWDAAGGGSQLGSTQTILAQTVSEGYFTVLLNEGGEFGLEAFNGSNRWLAISVRCPAGSGSYTPLTPRQALTATPYATFSNGAPWSGLSGVPAGFGDDEDDDVLGGLSCGGGEIPEWNGVQWVCGTDDVGTDGGGGDITAVYAGTGLAGGGVSGDVTLNTDTTYVQRRVGASCAAGSSIRLIHEDGSVSCESDDDSGGDVTAVSAGTGLSGGGESGDLSLSVLTSYQLPQSCAGGDIPEWDGALWTCSIDDAGTGTGDITAVNAGTGLSGGGDSGDVTLNTDTTYVQRRVSASCATGSSIRLIHEDGSVSCESDDDSGGDMTAVNAGTGMSGGGESGDVTLNADTLYLQRRVDISCSAGASIRKIYEDGSVDCEPDDVGGDVTAVLAGAGLSGGGESGDLSLSVLTSYQLPQSCAGGDIPEWDGALWTCSIDDAGTGAGDITAVSAGTGLSGGGESGDVTLEADTFYLQRRVDYSCTEGAAIRVIHEDGSVSCEIDDDSGDVTAVTAGAGLSGGGESGDLSLSVLASYQLPQSCSGGDIPEWDGVLWTCSMDDDSGGDITSVTAGTGLSGGGTQDDVTLSLTSSYRLPQSCSNGQIAEYNGSAWICAADDTGGNDHDHLGQDWTGDSSLYMLGSVGPQPAALLELHNTHESGNGLNVLFAGNHGVHVNSSGNDGVFVNSAGGDGFRVCATGSETSCWISNENHGLEVGRAEHDGVRVNQAGSVGVYVGEANNGVGVGSTSGSGFFVTAAGSPAKNPAAPYVSGFAVDGSGGYGLYVGYSGRDGIYLNETTYSGVVVNYTYDSGMWVGTAENDGVHVNSAGSDGGYGGYFNNGLYVSGSCTGCVIASYGLNTAAKPLEPGEVVAIRGVQLPDLDGQPTVLEVVPAGLGGAPVGVVIGRGEVIANSASEAAENSLYLVPREGAAAPGDYVHIAVYGPVQVQAGTAGTGLLQQTPTTTAIVAGTRLAVDEDGLVRPLRTVTVDGVQLSESGPTLGIALDVVDPDGMVWVLVNPQ